MADQENGAASAPDLAARELMMNAQYIKDLSFENPRAPHSLIRQQQQPEVALGVDVKVQTIGPNLYEVVLTIHAEAKTGADRIFLAELAYAGVVTLTNMPEDAVAHALLVETPQLLFPFARAIIADATRDGGFVPLLINPIDFAELVRRKQVEEPQQPPMATA